MPFRIDSRKVEEGDAATFERIGASSRLKYERDAAVVDEWLQQANALQGGTEGNKPTRVRSWSGSRAPDFPAITKVNGDEQPPTEEEFAVELEPEQDRVPD